MTERRKQAPRICKTVEDGHRCPALARGRDMCSMHYGRWHRFGDPLIKTRPRRPDEFSPGDTEIPCRRCKKMLPLADFTIDKKRPTGRDIYCKVCIRTEYIWKTYHITKEEYDALFQNQGHQCANPACGRSQPGGKGNQWHVDHDHRCCPGKTSCGKCVRGLLCGTCNIGLGSFRDDPEIIRGALRYLEKTVI